MKTALLLLSAVCLAGLSGCANDGTMRAEARIPIGENARYGTAVVSVGYIPPVNLPDILNQPTLRDK